MPSRARVDEFIGVVESGDHTSVLNQKFAWRCVDS